jgi:hypothetical protein
MCVLLCFLFAMLYFIVVSCVVGEETSNQELCVWSSLTQRFFGVVSSKRVYGGGAQFGSQPQGMNTHRELYALLDVLC